MSINACIKEKLVVALDHDNTEKAYRLIDELGDMVAAGARSVMLYVVQRADCDRFALAADIDPVYAAGFIKAVNRGVEVLCYACRVTTEGIAISRPLPVDPPRGGQQHEKAHGADGRGGPVAA